MNSLEASWRAVEDGCIAVDRAGVPPGYVRVNGYERVGAGGSGLPGPVSDLRQCEGVIYATVGKSVYALKAGQWTLAFTKD